MHQVSVSFTSSIAILYFGPTDTQRLTYSRNAAPTHGDTTRESQQMRIPDLQQTTNTSHPLSPDCAHFLGSTTISAPSNVCLFTDDDGSTTSYARRITTPSTTTVTHPSRTATPSLPDTSATATQTGSHLHIQLPVGVLPGEAPGCVPRGRRFAADDRARFTGMLPGKLFAPDPPVKDRFPVTSGEGMPASELNEPAVRYGSPPNHHTSPTQNEPDLSIMKNDTTATKSTHTTLPNRPSMHTRKSTPNARTARPQHYLAGYFLRLSTQCCSS